MSPLLRVGLLSTVEVEVVWAHKEEKLIKFKVLKFVVAQSMERKHSSNSIDYSDFAMER